MNRHSVLFAFVFAAAFSGVAKTFDVDVSTGRPAAANEAFYHGETVVFRPVRGKAVVTNIDFSCVWYQTPGMDRWWKTDGLVFRPSDDNGSAHYRFFLEGRDEDGRNWRANGALRFLDSPGFVPNALPMPALVLDFDGLDVRNAPWATESGISAATNEASRALRAEIAAVSNAALAAVDYSPANTALVATVRAASPFAVVDCVPSNGCVQLQDRSLNRMSMAFSASVTWGGDYARLGISSSAVPTQNGGTWTVETAGGGMLDGYGDETHATFYMDVYIQQMEFDITDRNDDAGMCTITVRSVDGVTLETPVVTQGYYFADPDSAIWSVSGPYGSGGGTFTETWHHEEGWWTYCERGVQESVSAWCDVVKSRNIEVLLAPAPAAGRMRDFYVQIDCPEYGPDGSRWTEYYDKLVLSMRRPYASMQEMYVAGPSNLRLSFSAGAWFVLHFFEMPAFGTGGETLYVEKIDTGTNSGRPFNMCFDAY